MDCAIQPPSYCVELLSNGAVRDTEQHRLRPRGPGLPPPGGLQGPAPSSSECPPPPHQQHPPQQQHPPPLPSHSAQSAWMANFTSAQLNAQQLAVSYSSAWLSARQPAAPALPFPAAHCLPALYCAGASLLPSDTPPLSPLLTHYLLLSPGYRRPVLWIPPLPQGPPPSGVCQPAPAARRAFRGLLRHLLPSCNLRGAPVGLHAL